MLDLPSWRPPVLAPNSPSRSKPEAPEPGARVVHALFERARRLFFPAEAFAENVDADVRLDAHILGGARLFGWVYVASLLLLHLPANVLLRGVHGPALATVLVPSLLTGLGLWASRRRWISGQTLGLYVAVLAALSLFGAAVVPAASPDFDPQLLLFILPLVIVSIPAFAPIAPDRIFALGIGTFGLYVLALATGLYGGFSAPHAFALAFVLNAALSATLLCYLRRQDLRLVHSRERSLLHANARLGEAFSQLERAQADLVREERMAVLGRLSAGIAHEINTPLAAARHALAGLEAHLDELAESIGHPEVTHADLHEIVRDLTGSARLAESALSRGARHIQAFKQQTRSLSSAESIDYDARREVESILALLGPRAREAGVNLSLAPGEAMLLKGDPGRFGQVVTNLVDNAIDASPAKARVLLTLSGEDEGARLEVVDHGAGVPPEVVARLFDPFFTTKPPGHGTGLGLAIARDLVEAVEGRLEYRPTPGGGATFVVWLPRWPAPAT